MPVRHYIHIQLIKRKLCFSALIFNPYLTNFWLVTDQVVTDQLEKALECTLSEKSYPWHLILPAEL